MQPWPSNATSPALAPGPVPCCRLGRRPPAEREPSAAESRLQPRACAAGRRQRRRGGAVLRADPVRGQTHPRAPAAPDDPGGGVLLRRRGDDAHLRQERAVLEPRRACEGDGLERRPRARRRRPIRSARAVAPEHLRQPGRRPRLCGNQNFTARSHRVVLHTIDATAYRWRGDAGSSPIDQARAAAPSPRND